MAPRAGRVHRRPESIGRLITREAQKKPEAATDLTGRLGSWSGSGATETRACLKGRRVPEVQKGVFTYFVWRTTPRLGDALELQEGFSRRRTLQNLEVLTYSKGTSELGRYPWSASSI